MKTHSYICLQQGPRETVVLARRALQPSRWARLLSWLPPLSGALFVVWTVAVLSLGSAERARFNAFKQAMREVTISVKLDRPTLSQESVDLAMVLYSVNLENHVSWPLFDASLADRGLTSGATLDARKSVTVGPAAFTSWGVLGSTLGHEVEIHCQQSFASILVLDKVNGLLRGIRSFWNGERAMAATRAQEGTESYGTWSAERTAYEYEIESAARFGLSNDEVSSIHQVMDYYYPAKAH